MAQTDMNADTGQNQRLGYGGTQGRENSGLGGSGSIGNDPGWRQYENNGEQGYPWSPPRHRQYEHPAGNPNAYGANNPYDLRQQGGQSGYGQGGYGQGGYGQSSWGQGTNQSWNQGNDPDWGQGTNLGVHQGAWGPGYNYRVQNTAQNWNRGQVLNWDPGQGQQGQNWTQHQGGYQGQQGQNAGMYGPSPSQMWNQDIAQSYNRVPGPYAGKGPRDYRRSDERIQEDICDRLTQHGQVDASDILVSVSQGEVTLQGVVPNRQMKRMAADVAENVPGVVDVLNAITVKQGGMPGTTYTQTGRGEKTATGTGTQS